MPSPIRIDVVTPSRSYPVLVGSGLLPQLRHALDEAGCGTRRFVVSNQTVWRFWGDAVREALPGAEAIMVPDGERFKILPTVARIYETLQRAGADRSSALITVGGGVVGDIGGFAAATYMRGITLVHVPTTLLAQVDASVGGKVGVNLAGGKNLVGAFHQPALVVTDLDTLRTLPRREFRAGIYEIIKYGVACSPNLFVQLQGGLGPISKRDVATLIPVIADCCRIKAEIVGGDEREAGPRRLLNFGHTAGHAFESLTRYQRFLHGEAVAYGMLVAAELAVARGLMRADDRDALASMIAQLGPLPPLGDLSAPQTIELMRRDKKVHEGRLHMVLPSTIGRATIVEDVGDDELMRALSAVGLAETAEGSS
ncbi:MAG: 3-dehydroquinate synthase [Acidobacteria bacterium]|nr:3-dehydroquinate synthase [Acidobacteriota bacterium]